MAMQRRMVEKPNFDLCLTVFDPTWFVLTGATRFLFVDDYSGALGTAKHSSIPGFQPETSSTGSGDSLNVSVYAYVTAVLIPGSISFFDVFSR